MRVSITLTWLVTACTVSAASHEAYVCTSGKSRPLPDPLRLVSPATARLALAQRLGVSQYYTLGDAADEVFDVLNELPGVSSQLLVDAEPRPFPRVLTVVEEVQDPEDFIRSIDHQPIFKILDPPALSENQRLLQDFMLQDGYKRKERRQDTCRFPDELMEVEGTLINIPQKADGTCTVPFAGHRSEEDNSKSIYDSIIESASADWTMTYHPRISTRPESGREDGTLENLRARLSYLARHPLIESTVVVLPKVHSRIKRAPSTWDPPNLVSRRLPSEEPLTPQASSAAEPSPSETTAFSLSEFGPASFPSPGPLPTCFSDRKALIDATKNCSSHGIPIKRFTDPDSRRDCYSCLCHPDVITDDEGRNKTHRWAGAACSKKDIGESFWLIAVVTIGLLGAAGWGVGLLASMGSEELPGVLSAGVGGPRAQK